ncbi:MAG: hypothetical protein ACPL7B_17550, partial [Candidatus Poribacteria bacterium]
MKFHYWIIRFIILIYVFSLYFVLTDFTYCDDLQKLDPFLKSFLVKKGEVNFAPTLDDQKRSDLNNLTFNTIIKIKDNPNKLASTGIRIRSKGERFVTADVPLESLSKLISLPNVIYVQSARKMQLCREMSPKLDVSIPEIRADQVWASKSSFTGKGVIVGII